jgi:hypothetical protein
MSRVTLSRRNWRNVLLSSFVLLATACASGGSPSGGPASASSPAPNPAATSTSASAALCSDVAALRGSLRDFAGIKPETGAAAELRRAVQNVQLDLASLDKTAGGLWTVQIRNLKAALTEVQHAVSILSVRRDASSVSGVVRALGGVSLPAHQLLEAVSSKCP